MPSDLVLSASDPRDAVAPPHRLDRPGLTLALAARRPLLQVTGRPGPGDLDRLAEAAGGRLLRMADDRHLVIDGPGEADAVAAAVAGRPLSVHDVADGLSTIAADGLLAAEVIAAGSGADLAPAVFPPGTAIATELGRLKAIVLRRHADGFDILVDSPSLAFAWTWATAMATRVAAAAEIVRERR